ncbi:hypothetical protein DFJ67_3168 [Asanoa ferruginea]|uniref:Tetratricopeptide repeat protein n=1 Tax=Asanoa ferruginea TaxID=53367 RepID=A0A3D9ZIW5_9ACTN|nr:tetratricopeptide repeat protein [Asanoa ferruginea]REF97171.1 hypothetical protein DFJ67_3168 [Asanoa ferruginea]GIF50121.1 hypothetical protein Afe04nite_46600 [Asanoa ferruginea]
MDDDPADLISAGQPLEAVDLLLRDGATTADGLRSLARAERELGHLRLAAGLFAAADRVGPPTPTDAAEFVALLVGFRAFRRALAFTAKLPEEVRDATPMREALAETYRAMELFALEVDAYRHTVGPLQRVRRRSWWRTGGPVGWLRRRRRSRDQAAEEFWPADEPDITEADLPAADLVGQAERRRGRDGRVRAALAAAEAMFDADDLVGAFDTLTAAVAVDGDSTDLLARLATICRYLRMDGQALELLAAARGIDPTDIHLADVNAWTLLENGRLREALALLDGLPAVPGQHPEIRETRAEIYWSMGLPTLARRAFGDPLTLSGAQRRRRLAIWLRAGGPLRALLWRPRRFEERTLRDWRYSSRHLPLLEPLARSTPDPAAVVARVDRFLQHAVVIQQRWWSIGWFTRRLSLLAGAVLAWFGLRWLVESRTALDGPGFASVGLLLTVGVLLVFFRFASAPTWDGVLIRGAPIGMVAVALGYALVSFLDQQHWAVLLGGSLIAATGMATLFFVSAAVPTWSSIVAERRLWRRNPREEILDDFLCVLYEVDDEHKRNDLTERARWVAKIERAARFIEHQLPRAFGPADAATVVWRADRAAGAATAVRQLKRHLIAPRADSWDRLVAGLRAATIAVASGQLGDLRWASPVSVDPRRRLKLALGIARTVAVAAIPFAVVLAVTPLVDFDSETLRWARLATLGWAVIYLLIAADPNLKDKIEVAQSTANFLRGSRTEPDRPEK